MAEVNQAYLGGRDIRERSFAFARRAIGLCDRLMAQCRRSWRGRAGESRFVSKCAIGLKEIRECHYRLRALYATVARTDEVKELVAEANQLVAIATTIVRNTRSRP